MMVAWLCTPAHANRALTTGNVPISAGELIISGAYAGFLGGSAAVTDHESVVIEIIIIITIMRCVGARISY